MGLLKNIIPNLYDPPFDEAQPQQKPLRERGYISEADVAGDERIQHSRANQTLRINDHRERF